MHTPWTKILFCVAIWGKDTLSDAAKRGYRIPELSFSILFSDMFYYATRFDIENDSIYLHVGQALSEIIDLGIIDLDVDKLIDIVCYLKHDIEREPEHLKWFLTSKLLYEFEVTETII